MVDINKIVDKILSPLNKCAAVVYSYPESFNKTPIISWYNLFESEEFRADNAEASQMARIQVDIWSDKKRDPGTLAIKVNDAMQNAGFIREFSRDLPKNGDDKLYHRTMRFAKEIFE